MTKPSPADRYLHSSEDRFAGHLATQEALLAIAYMVKEIRDHLTGPPRVRQVESRSDIEARVRAAVLADGEHHYLSTYCVHPDPEQHQRCRLESKCCHSPCVCGCHSKSPQDKEAE